MNYHILSKNEFVNYINNSSNFDQKSEIHFIHQTVKAITSLDKFNSQNVPTINKKKSVNDTEHHASLTDLVQKLIINYYILTYLKKM